MQAELQDSVDDHPFAGLANALIFGFVFLDVTAEIARNAQIGERW